MKSAGALDRHTLDNYKRITAAGDSDKKNKVITHKLGRIKPATRL